MKEEPVAEIGKDPYLDTFAGPKLMKLKKMMLAMLGLHQRNWVDLQNLLADPRKPQRRPPKPQLRTSKPQARPYSPAQFHQRLFKKRLCLRCPQRQGYLLLAHLQRPHLLKPPKPLQKPHLRHLQRLLNLQSYHLRPQQKLLQKSFRKPLQKCPQKPLQKYLQKLLQKYLQKPQQNLQQRPHHQRLLLQILRKKKTCLANIVILISLTLLLTRRPWLAI